MPDIDATLHFVTRGLEPNAEGLDQCAQEMLLFPEFSTLAHRERRGRMALMDLAKELLKKLPLDELTRRLVAGTPEVVPLTFKVAPAKRTEAWRDAVELKLEAVVWEQGAHALALLPALGIAVVAPDREELLERLPEHAHAAVKRGGWNVSRLHLALLQRGTLKLTSLIWSSRLGSPVERWKASEKEDTGPDPIASLTSRMEGVFLPKAFHVEDLVGRLARLLTLEDKPSVLLVGPPGVGKTALVQELARRRNDFGLARRPFQRSSGARLVAGACGFGMWQQRCRDLVQAAREKTPVFFFGNLFELMNVGQSSAGNESIASFLRPHLVRREIQVIVECTTDQLSLIEKNDPRVTDAFRVMRLDEPDAERASDILFAASIAMSRDRARFTKEALERVALLHRRYVGCAAFPGAPLRFMRRVHESVDDDRLVEESDIFAAFSGETGMPRALLNPAEPLNLDDARRWFAQCVQGQDAAADAVVAMIAQMKAGLSRPGRPLASLLFTGPTGTGKTEMAKSLATFLFQSPERMIRLDMSEYSQPWSAQRLVSGRQDGREGLLTAAVREQPFSVLLLDEFEKADPAVFDLLLQVLGEARLTDAAGRTADFSNCVVIMTSNLGAESFSRGQLGFQQTRDPRQEAAEHFTSAVQKSLRPEMFNRIDRIVPFLPLSADVVLALTRREVEAAMLRPGFATHGITLEVSERLLQHLAQQGYDPRYGARPLKRRVADFLLAPIAARMADGISQKSRIIADLDSSGAVKLQVAKPAALVEEAQALRDLRDRIGNAADLRRRCVALSSSTMVNGLTSKLRLLMLRLRAARRNSQQKQGSMVSVDHDPEVQALKRCLDRIEHETHRQFQHEESLLLALHRGDVTLLRQPDPLLRADLEATTLAAFQLWQPPPKRLVYVIQGDPGAAMVELARMYHALAQDLGAKVACGWFYKTAPSRLLAGDGLHVFADAPDSEKAQHALWKTEPGKVSAIALWVEGREANMMMKDEGGLHYYKSSREDKEVVGEKPKGAKQKTAAGSKDWVCRLDVYEVADDAKDLSEFLLPLTVVSGQPDMKSGVQRRQFDAGRAIVREGADQVRIPGTYSKSWLLQQLRDHVLQEALS